MNVLVTGGAGFIGSHLAERLLEDETVRVFVLDNLSTGRVENVESLRENSRFHMTVGTVTDPGTVSGLVQACDVVYHLAASVGVELIIDQPVETISTNVLGSEVVLSLAARYRRKVLVASTSEMYGKSEAAPFSEDDDRVYGPTTRSRWSYASSKAVEEFLALAHSRQHGLPVVIARLFNTVGPRQTGRYGMVVPRFVSAALAGKPLRVFGDGEQSRTFCDVSDVVSALVALMNVPGAEGEVVNVGSDREVTINELARRIVESIGSNSIIEHVPYDEAYEKGFEDMRRRVPNIEKLLRLTGEKPTVDLDTIISRVADLIRLSS
jgi:UDP-glucose 4-epimerase